MKYRYLTTLLTVLFPSLLLWSQSQKFSPEIRAGISQSVTSIGKRLVMMGRIHADSIRADAGHINVYLNETAGYMPFRPNIVAEIEDSVRYYLPDDIKHYPLTVYADGMDIRTLIPRAYSPKPTGKKKKKSCTRETAETGLVRNESLPLHFTQGLASRHIGMWQSHGYYYEKKLDRWEWQRARIFQTVEDLYTQSYVLPFLVPMLENAGANVFMPRERDCNRHEIIVDGDGYLSQGTYREQTGTAQWITSPLPGFAYKRTVYINHENPFTEGTFRQTSTIRKGRESRVTWTPIIPKKGSYAVYVSYKSLPTSTTDAHYIVTHRGQQTTFTVNQQMGGGTWIYLGHFDFDEGQDSTSCSITLTNLSRNKTAIVTADAVKIGGGMGNIARHINFPDEGEDFQPISLNDAQTSGYPRFCEAARYWMQWAGVPDSIYDLTSSHNDYNDDYMGRGKWINWLAGGSRVNPDEPGLNIPLDLSFAFHTDAGTTLDDRIIGSLAIYDTHHSDGLFPTGQSRMASRELTDLVLSQIVDDIQKICNPQWTRRAMWNKSYYEAWTPKVPAMLLELLSHQNFADMLYGLDPRFRFTVSRAIYKGMLRFISSQTGNNYAVQPLPVTHMMMKPINRNEIILSWQPTEDSLEHTATPDGYIVYTRIQNGNWDNGQLVSQPQMRIIIPNDTIVSWKVEAYNHGGRSFPSEILSAAVPSSGDLLKDAVLVVNGFDRISAPTSFIAPAPADTALAGFLDNADHGVPYLRDISYTGSMKEFRRRMPWRDDDAAGFGDSYANHETEVLAGNTFDYPALHGQSILATGHAFISCSDEAIQDGLFSMDKFPIVDLILGKECQTAMAHSRHYPIMYKTYTTAMQKAITHYLQAGGSIFISGGYVASDIWDSPVAPSLKEDRNFCTNILKYTWRTGRAAKTGKTKGVKSPILYPSGNYSYHSTLSPDSYVCESPDAIEPAPNTPEAHTIMRYSENNLSCAIAYHGPIYSTIIMGIPFETLSSRSERDNLMHHIIHFLEQ